MNSLILIDSVNIYFVHFEQGYSDDHKVLSPKAADSILQ